MSTFNKVIGLAVALTFLVGADNAKAADSYVEVQLGASLLSNAELLDSYGGVRYRTGIDTVFNTGSSATIALGLKKKNLRIEAEFGHSTNDISHFQYFANTIPASGSVSASHAMFNMFFEIQTPSNFVGYFGGGIGFAKISINNASVYGIPLADDSDIVAAMQFGGGVGYKITPVVMAVVDYRTFITSDPYFYAVNGAVFSTSYIRQTVRVGLRFSF